MTVSNKLTLYFCFIFSIVGFILPENLLAMMPSENGELFIPFSSGSESPFLLKLSMASFIVTFCYGIICLVLNKNFNGIIYVFSINCAFYMFCTFLILLDSSFVDAVNYGNWLPILQSVGWGVSVIIIAVTWLKDSKTEKLSV